MNKDKKDSSIVFSISSDLAFAVSTVILNLNDVSPNLADEIVIIHDGIKEKDQKIINSIAPVRFILYDFPISETNIFNQGTLKYFTKMVFAKYECLKLLDDYKKILYLDCDIVVLEDISEMFNICPSGIKMLSTDVSVNHHFHEPISNYNMEKIATSMGSFLLQDNLNNYLDLHKFCYYSTAKYAKFLKLPEQAIFDIMFQEFEIQPDLFDNNVYAVHPKDKDLKRNAKILHSFGNKKFWNGIENDTWNYYYNSWLKMGGSKFKKKSLIKRVLKRDFNIN